MYKFAGIAPKFAVAPMLDWTDRHCRYFHRLLSRKALLYTEMLNVQAVIFGNREKILQFDAGEHPVAVQLGGCDPHLFQEAAKICYDFGYDEININVGCPSPRVQSGSFGACLMKKPELIAQIVEKVKNVVPIPVTIKCRIGVDDQDSEKILDDLAFLCCTVNIDAFWIHARKAWLQGLSPKENRSIPPLDYDRVYRFKEKFSTLFVGINGGISSLVEAESHLRYSDGVMLGREVYHNPMILSKVDHSFYGAPCEAVDYQKIIDKMIAYCESYIQSGGYLSQVTKHMIGLFHGCKGARRWRQILSEEGAGRCVDAKILQKAFNSIENASL